MLERALNGARSCNHKQTKIPRILVSETGNAIGYWVSLRVGVRLVRASHGTAWSMVLGSLPQFSGTTENIYKGLSCCALAIWRV
eukprot:1675368-Prymnesium_polylepis.1